MSSKADKTRKKKRKRLHATTSNSDRSPYPIELLQRFEEVRKSWPREMERLFDPDMDQSERIDLWERMCSDGDELRRRFSWAIPDERALQIVKHFEPIVEIGCGSGYWAMLLASRGVDINAYDKYGGHPADTSRIGSTEGSAKETSDKSNGAQEKTRRVFWTEVKEGGPEALEEPCNAGRALLLCYPDEFEEDDESLGLRCLHTFEGDVVIHVGELFGDSIVMTPGHTAWGRTTSQECQEELVSKFHCILKVPLPRWPHSRDSLTVWKRHRLACIVHHDGNSSNPERHESEEEQESFEAAAPEGQNEVAILNGSRKNKCNEEKPRDCQHSEDRYNVAAGDSDSDDMSDEANEDEEALSDGGDDLDLYAFVPSDEHMSCSQAIPSLLHLIRTS